MTLNETLKQLQALGSAKVRAQNAKSGAGDNQFGVSRQVNAVVSRTRLEPQVARSGRQE